jgi:ubiquinone/menaquinone biosynthesis C-methylase UbiE
MEIRDAYELIRNNYLIPEPQIWCDLGCGSGIFTLALAELLPSESLIYAVDQNENSLKSIPVNHQNVSIQKYHADFVSNELSFTNLDGILMANSLHYVRDKTAFLRKIDKYVKNDFHFLIVEYDNDTPNNWVPFPLSFRSLKTFFTQNGYSKTVKLNERKSIYNSGAMYSALISKK